MQYVQRKLQRSITEIRTSWSGRWNWSSSWWAFPCIKLFRGNGFFLLVQGTLHRVPGQGRAFGPRRILPDTGENGELAEDIGIPVRFEFAQDQFMKLVEEFFGLVDLFTF